MNKTTLIDFLQKRFEEVELLTSATPKEAFYFKPTETVWSAAENVQHLIQSVQPLNRLFGRPKSYFAEKWGYATHSSRTYEGVVDNYHAALAASGGATGAFVPLAPNPDLNQLLNEFTQTNAALITHLTDWTEDELDKYVIPHPLMGLLTVGEMMLFTAYHTRHHLEIMEKRAGLMASQ
jgi:DinB superfamily